jgi:hypothetical protein
MYLIPSKARVTSGHRTRGAGNLFDKVITKMLIYGEIFVKKINIKAKIVIVLIVLSFVRIFRS